MPESRKPRQRCKFLLALWFVLLQAAVVCQLRAESARGKTSALATVHPIATDAGMDAFRQGGNAVDAAVAAALTLGVVDGHNSGLGGGCFILVRTAEGEFIAIDGRETAPAAATRDMYLRDGKPMGDLSRTGPLASGTPGALAAYALAVQKCGNLELAQLLTPAADIAERGFRIDRHYAARLQATAPILARYESSRRILLNPDGSPRQPGEILKQPELAGAYRAIAEKGPGWFYRGPLAEAVGRWMSEHGGILTAEDFASYRSIQREPIVTTYRGFTIVGFPPPSSGGIHVAQILNILEHFDLKQIYQDDPAQFRHLVAEAMKAAFADRAHWLGDADFARVPRGLIDKSYAARLAQHIDPQRSTNVSGHGTPPGADSDFFGAKHTTHIAAADSAGNWVAITATVNTSFGSKVIVPGTGVVLNNEMDDFSIHPGAPNAFGLIGAEANEVAPGKRPLSSMSPTIVLQNGRPVMTLGAAGGPKIITQVVLAIVNHLDLEMDVEAAVAAPRFHHQWAPDLLFYESALPASLLPQLKQRGHRLQRAGSAGVTQAIAWQAETREFIAVHDPRVEGQAAGN